MNDDPSGTPEDVWSEGLNPKPRVNAHAEPSIPEGYPTGQPESPSSGPVQTPAAPLIIHGTRDYLKMTLRSSSTRLTEYVQCILCGTLFHHLEAQKMGLLKPGVTSCPGCDPNLKEGD